MKIYTCCLMSIGRSPPGHASYPAYARELNIGHVLTAAEWA